MVSYILKDGIENNLKVKKFLCIIYNKITSKGSDYIITISEKLEIVLKRAGVTKKELADRLGMSQPNITKKFKYNDWRESDVVKVCEVIGVECEMIFTMDDGTKV